MPNGEDKRLNFTLKIWDAQANAYRPVYIAPDGTDTVQGDVKLSDATNSTLNAASGMTAATPAAVKAVADIAANKLDKVASADQTVASKVTFNNAVVGNKGITVPTGQYFTGNLSGNATTATTLQTSRQISVKIGNGTAGTANFNGGANAAIVIPQVDASVVTTGTLPLSVLPQGALERLVKVADEEARFALTTDDVQLGDSVLQIDTDTMYIVIDTAHLNSAAGYEEYAAGTAVLAETAEKVQHQLTVQKNGVTQFVYDGSVARTINIASSFADLTGQIAANQIPNGIITNDKLGVNYAGSATKGGSATSAIKLDTARTIAFTGVVTGSATFDGTEDVSIATTIGAGQITGTMLADNAVTTAKLSNNSVTSAKIVDGTIVAADIADATITGAKLVNSTITGGKIASNTITATNIANSTITNAKMAANSVNSSNIVDGTVTGTDLAANTVTLNNLASDVGTVAVQSSQPTDSNVKIWVQI